MAFPRYKNCCLCTNVKTGAIILAMIGLLTGGLLVFLDSVAFVYFEDNIDQHKLNKTIEFREDTNKTEEEIKQHEQYMAIGDIIKSFVTWVFVLKIVCAAIIILKNGSMLYGVIQKKAGFMLPWLIFGMMEIVCSSIFLLALGFFVLSFGTPTGILNGVIILFLSSLFVGLILYFWLVVRSAYKDLRETPTLPHYVGDPLYDDIKIEKAGGKYIRM